MHDAGSIKNSLWNRAEPFTRGYTESLTQPEGNESKYIATNENLESQVPPNPFQGTFGNKRAVVAEDSKSCSSFLTNAQFDTWGSRMSQGAERCHTDMEMWKILKKCYVRLHPSKQHAQSRVISCVILMTSLSVCVCACFALKHLVKIGPAKDPSMCILR